MRLTSKNRKSDVRRASLFLCRRLGAIGLVAGIVCIALHYLPTSWLVLVVATSLVPFGILAAWGGVIAFAIARSRRMGAIGVLVAVGASATQLPLYVSEGAGDGTEVTVMQANILFDGADAKTVIDLVQKHDVDILTVDELTPDVAAELEQVLPYRFVRPEEFANGTGIYSRFPLVEPTVYDTFTMRNLSAVATIPGLGDVPVFALHPVPPPYSASDWNREMTLARELLAEVNGPAIVGADFNATFDHAQFRALLGRFGAAVDQAGAGHLMTYPTDKWGVPIVGVDHILVAGGTATDVRAVDLPGSDHRALVATVVLTR